MSADLARALAPKPNRIQVLNPNLGFYNDRPSVSIPARGMSFCLNVRIRHGEITNERMGWIPFVADSQLPDPITMVENFRQRSGTSFLLIGTKSDVCTYNQGPDRLDFLNELYGAGVVTIGASPDTTLVGSGGADFVTAGIKAGDYVALGVAAGTYRNAEGDWYRVDSVTDATHLELEVAPGTNVGVTYTIRKTLTASANHIWSAATVPAAQPANEDTWYATNGVEIVKWNGISTGYTVLALGFTARLLAYYKGMLHYGDLLDTGERRSTSIRNSDVNRPEVFNEGTASEISVVEGTDRLMSLEILGDHLVCFAERSVNMIEFVGDPIGYTIRTALREVGPFAERLVVNQGDYIEFLANDRAYRFDGVGKSEMGSQVFREVLRTTAPDRFYQSHAYRDREEGEIQWVVALTTDVSLYPETSYVQHYVEPVGSRDPTPFTVRQLPATAIGEWTISGVRTFDQMTEPFSSYTIRWDDRSLSDDAPVTLFGDKDGRLWQLNVGQTKGGAPLWSGFRLARQPAIDGQTKGMLRTFEVYTRNVSGSQGIILNPVGYDDPLTDRVYTDTSKFAVQYLDRSHALYKRRAALRLSARYFEPFVLGLGDSTGLLVYSVAGYEMEIVPGGAGG